HRREPRGIPHLPQRELHIPPQRLQPPPAPGIARALPQEQIVAQHPLGLPGRQPFALELFLMERHLLPHLARSEPPDPHCSTRPMAATMPSKLERSSPSFFFPAAVSA